MHRPLTRGTSILAALVFVGILGAVAWGVSALSPSPLVGSQTAAVSTSQTPTQPDGGTDKDGFKTSSPKDCNEAISRALGKNMDGEVKSVDKNQSGTLDACYGAFSKTGQPSNKTTDYKCVGRAGVLIFEQGQVTATTRPSLLATPGNCRIKICHAITDTTQEEGAECSEASLYKGGIRATGSASGSGLPGETAQMATPKITDGFGQTPTVGGANGSDQVSGAFDLDAYKKLQDACSGANAATCDSTDLNKMSQMESQLNADLKKFESACSGASAAGCDSTDLQKLDQLKEAKLAVNPPKDSADPLWCDGPGRGTTDCGGTTPPREKPVQQQPPQQPPLPPQRTSSFPPPAQGPNSSPSGGDTGMLSSLMKGLLGGLAKGLAQSAAQGSGQPCSSDPNAYAQQQQQYNMQLQQYQYQMQQAQMQQQYSQYYGYPTAPAPLPPPPVGCTPNSNQNTCPAQPAQPNPSGCPNGTYKPVTTAMTNGVQCISSWQCVPTGANTPTAQISCQPQTADVGMSVAISFSCGGATGSTGSGFDTKNALSGSTTTIMTAVPQGATGAVFGVQCTNAQGVAAQAQCNVQVGKASIVLVANPKVVQPGSATTIGWITSRMQQCVVSSPDLPDFTAKNANNTSVNGMATTSPLTHPAHILLHCTTVAGGTKDATTTVSVYGIPDDSNGPVVSVRSSIDGMTVPRGSTTTISWSVVGAPSSAKMSLWLYDVRLGQTTALIKTEAAASSTYSWAIPRANDACDDTSNFVCGSDLVPGRQYGIEADLYTGPTTTPTYLGDPGYSPESFTISS